MKALLHGMLALAAGTLALNGFTQCPDGTTEVTVFFSDFEGDNGGLVNSGEADWEYGTIPVTLGGTGCEGSFNSPGGAFSGTKGWGTILDGCYHNSGAYSGVGFTVDLGDPAYSSARLDFAHWYNVFTYWDYLRVTANDTEIFKNDVTENSGGWLAQTLDLTPFLGQSTVTIVFDLWASTVVNRAGWYIDDVGVYACVSGTQAIAEGEGTRFKAWPVPAREELHVEPARTVTGWVLYDATGRVLAQGERGNAERFSIDVSPFHGMGVLELRTPDGLHRQRVIIE